MSNYSKLTKVQLIAIIDDLEERTVEARLRQIRDELAYIKEDLLALCRSVYEAGAATRRAVDTFSLFKPL